jgi:hypothetical protein
MLSVPTHATIHCPFADAEVLEPTNRAIHDRMTTILEPRDCAAYLEPSDRPPVHLLRVLPGDEIVPRWQNNPISPIGK